MNVFKHFTLIVITICIVLFMIITSFRLSKLEKMQSVYSQKVNSLVDYSLGIK